MKFDTRLCGRLACVGLFTLTLAACGGEADQATVRFGLAAPMDRHLGVQVAVEGGS